MASKHLVDIIIPTINNIQYLSPCVQSMLMYKHSEGLFHISIINNGHPNSCDFIKRQMKLYDLDKYITVYNAGKNLGWEGGLKYGIERTKAPFVCFANDDIFIPLSSILWLYKMLAHFRDPKVGAVGPSSNVVMGKQNIFNIEMASYYEVPYLIGFCLLTKRSILKKVGGIITGLPGGDDLDLSIRLKNKGYKLIADKTVFVFHHGFKTGNRIHGDHKKIGGWNNWKHTENINKVLIKRHGFRKWWECLSGAPKIKNYIDLDKNSPDKDREGKAIRKLVGKGKIIELGCGGKKTIKNSIGIDIVPKGELIDSLTKTKSVADIQADLNKPLPNEAGEADYIIARHILEHLIDTAGALMDWFVNIKEGGKLIIAVPNEEKLNPSIPVNIEHKHAFVPKALYFLFKLVGFKDIQIYDPDNNVSFIIEGTKR